MSQVQRCVEESVFRFLLDLEVPKAIRLQYCVSVLCLRPDLAAGTAGASVVRQIAQTALRPLRATDLATTFSVDSATCIALLLIDAETRTLPQILARVTELQALAVWAEGAPLSWSAGGSCYPQTVSSGRDLLHQAVELMTCAKAEGGNRLCLPS